MHQRNHSSALDEEGIATRMSKSGIIDKLHRVAAEIAEACDRAGRNPADVTVVAVSKGVEWSRIEELVHAGQLPHLGENRVQEAAQKVPLADGNAEWHLIGHLQTNKVKAALDLFQLIHSVDRTRLATEISRRAEASGQTARVLLQINVSGEASKGGVPIAEAEDFAAAVLALPGLKVEGLMTMAPFAPDPEAARPVFGELRLLHERLQRRFPENDWRHLSMGMSQDYRVAVEEGATLVRIGSEIFGRPEGE